jgi:hypothetical protein
MSSCVRRCVCVRGLHERKETKQALIAQVKIRRKALDLTMFPINLVRQQFLKQARLRPRQLEPTDDARLRLTILHLCMYMRMFMCKCMSIWICVCVCAYAYACVCVFLCVCVYLSCFLSPSLHLVSACVLIMELLALATIPVCMRESVHACACVCVCVCMCKGVCMPLHLSSTLCTHTHTHTHTHTGSRVH